MKTSTQLKAQIRNLAVEQGVDAAFLLRRFLLERFLERVCVSRYRDNFVLKGGLLVSSIAGIRARTTMDVDASVRRLPLSPERMKEVLEAILSVPLDDGAALALRSVGELREGEKYFLPPPLKTLSRAAFPRGYLPMPSQSSTKSAPTAECRLIGQDTGKNIRLRKSCRGRPSSNPSPNSTGRIKVSA